MLITTVRLLVRCMEGQQSRSLQRDFPEYGVGACSDERLRDEGTKASSKGTAAAAGGKPDTRLLKENGGNNRKQESIYHAMAVAALFSTHFSAAAGAPCSPPLRQLVIQSVLPSAGPGRSESDSVSCRPGSGR